MKKSMLVALTLLVASIAGADTRSQPRNAGVGQLAELRFATGSARLPVSASLALSAAVGWAKQYPQGLIVVEGYADRVGTATRNATLSLNRAIVVRDALLAAGVEPEQIVVTAYGEEHRRGTALAPNRRVDIWTTRAGRSAVIAYAEGRGRKIISLGESPPTPIAIR